MAEQRWTVECEDLFGRPRDITVLTHVGRIVMVVPPGEAAQLTLTQVDALTSALDNAIAASRHNGRTDVADLDRLSDRDPDSNSSDRRN